MTWISTHRHQPAGGAGSVSSDVIRELRCAGKRAAHAPNTLCRVLSVLRVPPSHPFPLLLAGNPGTGFRRAATRCWGCSSCSWGGNCRLAGRGQRSAPLLSSVEAAVGELVPPEHAGQAAKRQLSSCSARTERVLVTGDRRRG